MKASENENELVAACIKGEAKAMKRLYDLHAPRLLALAVRYVRERSVAEDVLHDGFVKILTKIEQFDGDGALRAWMNRIIVNEALQFLRSKAYRAESELVDDGSLDAVVFSNESVHILSANELMACVADLPAKYRTVFNMFAIEGYSHVEIAEMLHIEESTSRSQYARARKMLQEKIRLLIGGNNEGR